MNTKNAFFTLAWLLISQPLLADNWQWYGKWEVSHSQQQNQNTSSLISRIMGDKSHHSGAYQIHLQSHFLHTDGSLPARQNNHYQLGQLAEHQSDTNHRLSFTLDRLNTAIFTEQATWVIGRQAISLGQSLLFTPLGLGNQLAVPSIDTEYAPGVDAMSGDIWTDNGNLQLIAALGSDTSSQIANWEGSAFIGRYTSHTGNLEWAWQGGKINQAYQLGGGLSGDHNSIAYRLEFAHTQPASKAQHGSSFSTLVAGLGHQANDELHMELEYMYNGGAKDSAATSLARIQAGMLASRNEALVAATASYQFTPLTIGQVTHFKALTDQSQFTTLGFFYSISDNSNINISSTLYTGLSNSEFGAQTNTHTLTYRSYF